MREILRYESDDLRRICEEGEAILHSMKSREEEIIDRIRELLQCYAQNGSSRAREDIEEINRRADALEQVIGDYREQLRHLSIAADLYDRCADAVCTKAEEVVQASKA